MAKPEPSDTIVVTGASGLLGSRVVPLLRQAAPSSRIITVVRRREFTQPPSWGAEVVSADLRDPQAWRSFPAELTHVIHLAAVIPWNTNDRWNASVVSDNVAPIANLIESSTGWPNLKQIVYSSSVSVYGPSASWLTESASTRPISLYGAAKLCGEDLLACLAARGVAVASLRFSSLYASGHYEGTVLPIMVNRARQREPLMIFGDGSRTQDFLHCEDAAAAIVLTFEKRATGVYNVGSGVPTTMSELARTAARVFADGSLDFVFQPEKTDTDPGIKLDITKAQRELAYQPGISLEAGLQKLKLELTGNSGEAHAA